MNPDVQIPRLSDIRAARERIRDVVHTTPIITCRSLSEMAGGSLFMKCESFQRGGSFKIRGAYNKLSSLSVRERERGVTAYSSGNHAQGVALAAKLLGVRATIFMPVDAPVVKLAGVKHYGARHVLVGITSTERQEASEAFGRETGAVVVPPFDDPLIVAGQGTIGLELLEQLPDLARVVVPIGGGGLISGVSTAIKSLEPDVEVIGVEPELACKMTRSLEAGKITETIPGDTVADGLKPSAPGQITFAVVRKNVDRVVVVAEDEIIRATGLLMERAKLVIEPSGATTLAACLSGKVDCTEGKTALVLSGGNVDLPGFFRKTGTAFTP